MVPAVAEQQEVGQGEVPPDRDLVGQRRGEQVVDAQDAGEQIERQEIRYETGGADRRVPDHPQPVPTDAQPRQVAHEAQPLGDGGLGLPGVARGELVRHLDDPAGTVAYHQFQQDLVAQRPQLGQLQRAGPYREEPAHRVAHLDQRGTEQHLGHHPRALRDQVPVRVGQARAAAPRDVPAGHHQVRAVPDPGGDQVRYRLGRVLEVGVHDDEPDPLRHPQSLDNGTAEPTGRFGPVVQPYRDRAGPRLRPDDRRSVVRAVVHDDDLGIRGGQYGGEPGQQRDDVRASVWLGSTR